MSQGGLVLGSYRGRILRWNGAENVLLVGPQRQGKGIGVIIPSLLELPHEHVIVIDVRGETWDATAGYRSQFSRCLRLSLTQPGSVRFNLPQAIRKGTHHEYMDAAVLGDMMVDPGGNKPDRDHWEKTAKALITCGLLYEVHRRVVPTLSHMASFWSQPGKAIHEILQHVVETAPTRQVAELAQEVRNKAANEASGVLSSMMTQLFLFRDPLLAANTRTCDFTLEDFTRHDQWTSLYIVLSPGEEEYLRPFLRMFLQLALQRWMEMGATTHRMSLILDEFTSWGRLPFFVTDLAVLGGRGIRTLLAVQNTPQLKDTYGDSDLITEQCKVRLYFAANGQTTAREISRQTGTGTATTLQETQRRGWGRGSTQAHQHARSLLTESEAMQIPPNRMVMQVAGYPPIWTKKIRYWKHRTWRRRSQIPAPEWRVP
jgi:type IV secretion system protein VirD4